MKKNLTYTLVAAIALFFSANAFAQKSVAIVNSSTGTKMIDEKTAVVTFNVSNVTSEAAKQKMAEQFQSTQPVMEVKSSLQGTTATYNVTMPKKGVAYTMQNMLVKAGVETVNFDGTDIASTNIVTYKVQAKKNKQSNRTTK